MARLLSRKAWKKQLQSWFGKEQPKPKSAVAVAAEPVAPPPKKKNVNVKLHAARELAKDIEFLVPQRPIGSVLPGGEVAEVVMLPQLIRSHTWAMPEHELLVLGAIVRSLQPSFIVEFGTFRGGSTLVMCANQPSHGRVVTVDIDPTTRKSHEHGLGTGLLEFDVGCLFKNTRFASRIEQRFANSVLFNDESLTKAADLVFVDADHTYEFARRDTETALRFLKPGGTIVWHDYSWEPQHSECAGVTKTVNEFWQEHGSCHHIAGTRFAIYRDQRVAASRAA